MTKIRKLFAWFWRNKERMVLIVMVAILCQRVYQVMYPKPPEDHKRRVAPGDSISELPPLPPPRPLTDVKGAYASLYRKHPLWLHSKIGSKDKRDEGVEELSITLHNITTAPRLSAQLSTKTARKKWYSENEPFEKFRLESINVEDKTVDIFSEEHNKVYTISQD
jgi:hypothetical protein